MARGSQAKENITNTILETFGGSFVFGKEIRIPYEEDGVSGQIKVTLTAAKQMVENDAAAGALKAENASAIPTPTESPQEPTDEEKARLKKLMERLNL